MTFFKGLESLEGRRMFSATAVLVHHDTLIVRGDPAETSLQVTEAAVNPVTDQGPNFVSVNEFIGNSLVSHQTFAGVKHIVIYGTNAADTISYTGDDLGATIIGGGGSENLFVFGGPGNVIIAPTYSTIFIDSNPNTQAAQGTLVIAGTGTGPGQGLITDDGVGTTIIRTSSNDTINPQSTDTTGTVYTLNLPPSAFA